MKFISLRTLRALCLDLIIFLIPLVLMLWALPFIFRLLLPFIFGFFLYIAAKPLKEFLQKRGLPSSLCAALSLIIISFGVFFLFRIIGGRILAEIRTFAENPPLFSTESLNSALSEFSSATLKLRFRGVSPMPDIIQFFRDKLLDLAETMSTFLLNFAKALPSLFIAAFASVFTAYFLLKESDVIFPFFRRFIGGKLWAKILFVKETLLSVLISYLRAQIIIEGIIFAIAFAGFFILGIRYAFLLALLTAVVDAVPILGTGTVLIPLAIFNFLSSGQTIGWGMIILYGITLITRQLCEPKILGKSLGIHPLATVFSLYAGMKLLGIWGIILGPIAAIFVKILIFPSKNTNKCLHF